MEREKLEQVLEWLRPFRCCGAPNLCGATCMDDEESQMLALAERGLRELQQLQQDRAG